MWSENILVIVCTYLLYMEKGVTRNMLDQVE